MTLKEESDKMELKFFPFYDSLYDMRYEMNNMDPVFPQWFEDDFPQWFEDEWARYRDIEFKTSVVSIQTKEIIDNE